MHEAESFHTYTMFQTGSEHSRTAGPFGDINAFFFFFFLFNVGTKYLISKHAIMWFPVV
jgi:hypothetical protein